MVASRKWCSVLALAAVVLAPLPLHAETLHQALAHAYTSNPTLRAERARQRGTDEQVPQALSGWRPQIDAQASATHQWTDRGQLPTVETSPGTLSIQLRQPIFDGFRTIESTKAAEANVRAGRQQLLATEQEILFRAVQAYANVIRDQRILTLRRQNVGILEEQYRAARSRFAVGEITKTDVSQSNARLSQSRAAVASAVAQLKASEASYVALMGHGPNKLNQPSAPRMPSSLDRALSVAQQTNPNILAAAQVADSASFQINVARSDLLPSLSFQATGTLTDDWDNPGGVTKQARVEGVLNVPIYDGGLSYSNVREAKQIASQRRIQIIEATRSVRESVTSAWNFQIAARATIASAKQQVSASQEAVDGVREEYLVGSRSTIDVLNAQQELLNARISLVQAERDYVVASYQVLGAMGKLTARYLALRVAYYDPVQNYNQVRNQLFGSDVKTVK